MVSRSDGSPGQDLDKPAMAKVGCKGQRTPIQIAHGRQGSMRYPVTPDGRYFVVRGRLWRCTNPALDVHARDALTRELMSARRAKQDAMRRDDPASRDAARGRVDSAKQALGERGPVWWDDGAPDYNRHMARNTPYAAWFAVLAE